MNNNMKHNVLCSLCQTDTVPVDFGPVCRGCLDAADPQFLPGAALHAFMDVQRASRNDMNGLADGAAKLLRPFASLSPAGDWKDTGDGWEGAMLNGIPCMVRSEGSGYWWGIGARNNPTPSGSAKTRERARQCALWAATAAHIITQCRDGNPLGRNFAKRQESTT